MILMINIKKNLINDIKNNKQLKTQSFREWLRFVRQEIFFCKITPIQYLFYGDINVVSFNNDFLFIALKASPHKAYDNKHCDYLYVIASRGPISWENGTSTGTLPLGGIILLDLNKSFSLSIESEQEIVSFLVPFRYLGNRVDFFKQASQVMEPIYSQCILDIMFSMSSCNTDLRFKMQAVANLLMINIDTTKIETREERDLKIIVEFIEDNILDSTLSLDKVSKSLLMSKSKVQKILVNNNMSYSKIIKIARVNILSKKIIHTKNKTLSQLCYESGFNSTSNAAIQFKIVKMMSIAEYKNSLSY